MLIELITWEFDYFLNENYRVRELMEGVSEVVQLINFFMKNGTLLKMKRLRNTWSTHWKVKHYNYYNLMPITGDNFLMQKTFYFS